MKKNAVTKIIIAVIVVILCIPIISDMVSNSAVKSIEYSDLESTIQSTSSYGFGLIYVAPGSSEGTKTLQENVKSIIDTYQSDSKEVKSYFIDYETLSSDEITDIFGASSTNTEAYMFAVNGEVIKTVEGSLDSSKLNNLVKEYTSNGVAEDVKYYKTAETAEEYTKLVAKKKTVTMAVFGRESCYYCNQFLPVVNTVAEDYNLGLYYFDSDNYDSTEYQKIKDYGLVIPASCSDSGKETKFGDGFSTPLTLFTKNGKVIDCISGYVNKAKLIAKLETLGLISTEE